MLFACSDLTEYTLTHMIDSDECKIDLLLKEAEKAALNYAVSTKTDCYVIDIYGNVVSDLADSELRCSFCRQFFKITGISVPCRKVQRHGSYQAEIYGGKYIYFCPVSLLHWTSPLIYKGLLVGALVAGPALLFNPEDIIQNDLPSKYQLDKDQQNLVHGELQKFPRLSTERAGHLADLLSLTTRGLSQPMDIQQLRYREKTSQQSSISSYIHQLKKEESDLRKTAYPIEKEEKLLHFIQEGNKQESQRMLNEILGHIYFSEGQDFEKLRNCSLELTILLSRAAMKGGAGNDQVWGLKYNYIKRMQETRSGLELTFLLDQLLKRFMDQLFDLKDVKHADAIFRSIQYIKKNYASPLTLHKVAEEAFLSDAYFSTIFKEEVGTSFKNYLNRVRVENSKKLLADRTLVIGDIARLCGFEEQSYYTRVFKKICGMPPGQYRERGLRD